jgi:hypothetical protein
VLGVVIFLGLFCVASMVLGNYLFEYAHGRAWKTAFDRSYFQSVSVLAYMLLLLLSGTSCSARREPVDATQAKTMDAPETCQYEVEYIAKAGNLRVDAVDERGWSNDCLIHVMKSIKTAYGKYEMGPLSALYTGGRTKWMIISFKQPIPESEVCTTKPSS